MKRRFYALFFVAFAQTAMAQKAEKIPGEGQPPPVERPEQLPAPSAEAQIAIDKNVELVRKTMPEVAGIAFDYDEASIEWLDGYINRMREEFDGEPGRLGQVLASYIGESIRRKYGGRWVEAEYGIGVEIRPNFVAFPFNKVSKQFENGQEDSVFSFYQSIQPLLDEANAPTH